MRYQVMFNMSQPGYAKSWYPSSDCRGLYVTRAEAQKAIDDNPKRTPDIDISDWRVVPVPCDSTRFDGFTDGKLKEFGDEFDDSDLAVELVPHFNAGDLRRVKVDFGNGIVKWGCLGVTTGRKPVFLLLRNRFCKSSGDTLTPGTFRVVDHKDLRHPKRNTWNRK